MPSPVNGRVSKEQAPELTRNERRRYATMHRKIKAAAGQLQREE
jgi:hypothetical protein